MNLETLEAISPIDGRYRYETKEISEYPTKYIGSHCPLNFDGEIKETK